MTSRSLTAARLMAPGYTRALAAALLAVLLPACGKAPQEPAQDAASAPPAEAAPAAPVATESPASAGPAGDPDKQAWFGEEHLHTAYSLDAYIGGARLTPFDAYRFCRGAEVEVNGVRFRIDRALDWCAVTDHAEYLGEMYTALVEGAPGYDAELTQNLRGLQSLEEREEWFLEYVVKSNRGTPAHAPFYAGPQTTESAWKLMVEAAELNYEPGHFSTLVAFEWSGAPNGGNLHRNVFFRDLNVPAAPVSYIDVRREDGLWDWLAGLEAKGMQAIAIPHNSNASKQQMFATVDGAGQPIDRAYAERRSRFEPAIEIMQIKGNSEVHRNFWPADEFADFENADSIQSFSGRTFKKQDFVRAGLIEGLVHAKALGANPYKYGIVGGTDSHNGTPANVAEDNFMAGSHGAADGTVELRRTSEVGGWIKGKDLNPGALTAVWAPRNTREDIFDAIRARETFATSGPRMKIRFFGGWDYPADLVGRADMVRAAYDGGVPMGGDLPPAPADGAPRFLVWAQMDPQGANLDRVQVVKGWVDASGQAQERVYDVAWSDPATRQPAEDGKLPAVGNTVDVTKATWSNSIGAAELAALWTDPEFDPAVHALYYLRVLQIPTPRWSTYDAVRAGLPLLEDVAATVQERAWSSPIWYTPRAAAQ